MNNYSIWEDSKYTERFISNTVHIPIKTSIPVSNALIALRTHSIFSNFHSTRLKIRELLFDLYIGYKHMLICIKASIVIFIPVSARLLANFWLSCPYFSSCLSRECISRRKGKDHVDRLIEAVWPIPRMHWYANHDVPINLVQVAAKVVHDASVANTLVVMSSTFFRLWRDLRGKL